LRKVGKSVAYSPICSNFTFLGPLFNKGPLLRELKEPFMKLQSRISLSLGLFFLLLISQAKAQTPKEGGRFRAGLTFGAVATDNSVVVYVLNDKMEEGTKTAISVNSDLASGESSTPD